MIARFCLVAAGLVLVAGCGGGSQTVSPTTRIATTMPADMGPAFDAPADEVAAYLDGAWTISLLPQAASEGVQSPKVDAVLVIAGESVTGSVAGNDITDGALVIPPAGEAYPSVAMTTDGMTIPGPVGEIEVPGPIEWSAELFQGKLIGTAVGPDGRRSAWEGTRSDG
ncbi:MAG: hypothetical protein AAGI46_09695 [Planctomycetota bacterium]